MELTTYTTVYFKINYSSGRTSELSGTIFTSAEELVNGLDKLVEFITGGIPMRLRVSVDSIEVNCFLASEGFPMVVSPYYRLLAYTVRDNKIGVFKNDLDAIITRYNEYDIDLRKVIFDLRLGSSYEIYTVGDEGYELDGAQ